MTKHCLTYVDMSVNIGAVSRVDVVDKVEEIRYYSSIMSLNKGFFLSRSDVMVEIKFTIGKKEVNELKKALEEVKEPVNIDFLSTRLKTILSSKFDFDLKGRLIKIYESGNDYIEGDIIAKRFEKLRISQKKIIDFRRIAAGTIYERIVLPDSEYDLICVDWEEPMVRKQTEFFRSNNAIQYLPINYGDPRDEKYLGQDDEEREKDEVLIQYEKNLLDRIREDLLNVLFFEEDFINWGSRWYFIDLVEEVDFDVVVGIEKMLEKAKKPLPTEDFIKHFYNIGPDSSRFLHYRFSLNFTMENFFPDKFVCLSHHGGGKWALRADIPEQFGARPIRISTTKLGVKLSESRKSLPSELVEKPLNLLSEEWKREILDNVTRDEMKRALTYNEFVTNTLDITQNESMNFPDDSSIVLTDTEDGAEYRVTYHYRSGFFTGLEELYTKKKMIPGAILILKRTDEEDRFDLNVPEPGDGKTFDYVGLDYNAEIDRVGITSMPFSGTMNVDERFFIETDKIEGLEDIRAEERISGDFFQTAVKIFKLYQVPLHPLKLWHLMSSIVDVSTDEVFTILSKYKCFQYCNDEVNLGKYRMNPSLIGSTNLKKGVKGKGLVITPKPRVVTDSRKRFYRPKCYFTTLSPAHWKIIKKYGVLPMGRLSNNLELRFRDKVAILFDEENVGGAVEIVSEREMMQPHLRQLFKDDKFNCTADCRILGDGVYSGIELFAPPELGGAVETDADTFHKIEMFYEEERTAD